MKKNTLKSLQIQNLLSFGKDSPKIELGDLNILIGPNGSGKSNLIEIIGLIRSTPRDFSWELGVRGGVDEWLWKGRSSTKIPIGSIQCDASPNGLDKTISYRLSFTRDGSQLRIVDERIENQGREDHDAPDPYFAFNDGSPILNVAGHSRSLKYGDVDTKSSILSQRQDPDQYPEVTYLGRYFASFRLYRTWQFGPDSRVRDLYAAGQRNDFLDEDVGNLGLMLNRLRADSSTKTELLRHLKMFYAGAEDILTPIQGGMVDLRIEEEDGVTIPASRLSDGTLRWLSLLTILLHPSPPPLVCIEEPELGLHPDMIQPLAKLLLSASERMQLVVTTHSGDLIDEMSGNPSAVIVCEKRSGSSVFRRLDGDQLSEWLERYRLGQLWRTGEIGGNRW